MSFVTPEILSKLGTLTSGMADRVNYGIFQLDDKGRVLLCNRTGCELLGVPRAEVPGKNFFSEIAPSARNPLFEGKFMDGLRRGELNHAFEYALRANGGWIDVMVHLVRHPFSRTNWLFIRRCRELSDPSHASLERLREQLSALYQERDASARRVEGTTAAPETAPSPEKLEEAEATGVSRTASLTEISTGVSTDSLSTLEEEVARLTQEKQALELELQTLKRRARDIGAAMFEAALLGKKIAKPY